MLKKFAPALMAAALLAGCQTSQKDSDAAGGVYGGVINSQYGSGNAKLAQLGVGPLLGAFIGKDVAGGLSKDDQGYAETAAKRAYAAPLGERISWVNPQSGNSGTITSIREGYNTQGTYCREYQQTVTVGRNTELVYGTACKQADGAWKIVTNS